MDILSVLFKLARLGIDVKSLSLPERLARRLANKQIGRHVVRRLWLRGGKKGGLR